MDDTDTLDRFLFLFGQELQEPLYSLYTRAKLCSLTPLFMGALNQTIDTRDLHRVLGQLCETGNTPMDILEAFYAEKLPVTIGEPAWRNTPLRHIKRCTGLNFTRTSVGATSSLTFAYPEAPAAYFICSSEAYILVTPTDRQVGIKTPEYTFCVDGLTVKPAKPMDNKGLISFLQPIADKELKQSARKATSQADIVNACQQLRKLWAFQEFPLPYLEISYDKVQAKSQWGITSVMFPNDF